MQGTDQNPAADERLVAAADILVALGLLTRLPVPVNAETAQARSANIAWAYPLAGLVVGGFGAATGYMALWLTLPVPLVAGLVLLSTIVVTGALHEDGLADTADGFWGGRDRAGRLKIMKDSHIGSFGVIALILSVGLRWSALSVVIAGDSPALSILAAAVLSRGPMVAVMATLPNARDTGLSVLVGRPAGMTALLAIALALAGGAVLLGLTLLPVAAVLCLTTIIAAAIARTKIGGQTGDVLGAVQQIGEVAVLATLAALVS